MWLLILIVTGLFALALANNAGYQRGRKEHQQELLEHQRQLDAAHAHRKHYDVHYDHITNEPGRLV